MFKRDTLVMVSNPTSQHYRRIGRIVQDQEVPDSSVTVSFDYGTPRSEVFHSTNLKAMTKAEEYRKGDRVEVINNLGRDSGKQGTVMGTTALMSDTVNVQLDDERGPCGRHYSSLLLIDPAPRPLPYRAKDALVKPEDVRKGDVISVKSTVSHSDGYESQVTHTGVVGVIGDWQITTPQARVLWDNTMKKSTITLVQPIKDEVEEALTNMAVGAILTWTYGKNDGTAVALKVDERKWHMIGATGPIKVSTDRLREYLFASGDSYTILQS